jgi:hypothetical protein
MAPEVPFGTPSRSPHWVPPPPANRGYRRALLLFALLAVVGCGLLLSPEGWRLRRHASPGAVAAAHAVVEDGCAQCHSQSASPFARGAADARCVRCHAVAPAGDFDHGDHVRVGGGDPAGTTPRHVAPSCASCHVDHRGRAAELSAVADAHCASCHFGRFAAHPEFQAVRERAPEAPGLAFNHERHLRPDALKAFAAEGLGGRARGEAVCAFCHEPDLATREFVAPGFDRHCARCHERELQAGSREVAAELLLSPRELASLGVQGPGLPPVEAEAAALESARFEATDFGEVRLRRAVHRDAWIVANRDRLARALAPAAFAAARERLVERRDALVERLAAGAALAALSRDELRAREIELVGESAALDQRLAARATAVDPAPLGALGAPLRGLASDPALGPSARELLAAAGSASAVDDRGERDRTRQALLAAARDLMRERPDLEAELQPLIARLRVARVDADAERSLERTRRRVAAGLEAVREELRLIDDGVRSAEGSRLGLPLSAPAAVEELARLDAALAASDPGLPGLPAKAPEEIQRALVALWAPCAKCHAGGATAAPLPEVRSAAGVLDHARFLHAPHLDVAAWVGEPEAAAGRCATCHAGVEKSAKAADLHLPGVASCARCHGRGAVGSGCIECHSYHPGTRR